MKRQADGRYRAKLTIGTRADGKKIYKYISGRTRKELEDARRRVLAVYRDGQAAPNSDLMANDWIMRWYDTVAAPRQNAETAAQKRRTIERYVLPLLDGKQLRAVTALDLQEIVNAASGSCRTILTRITGVLRGAFASAYAQGYIARDPSVALEARKKPYTGYRALSETENASVQQNLAERATEPLLLGLLYYTGMRIGEALGLQWRDIDFKGNTICVERTLHFRTMRTGKPKTEAGIRTIPMCDELKAILAENRGIGEGFVVTASRKGGALPESSYKLKMRRIQRAIGAPDLTAHCFRYNYATRLFDACVDELTAARIFGHTDPATMHRIYVDIERSRRISASTEAARHAFSE